MKKILNLLLLTAIVVSVACTGNTPHEKGEQAGKERHKGDTGYTGIKNYFSGEYKVKDVEFKNGIKDGVTHTYYKGGIVKNEILYKNNVKNGDSKWYYPDGKLFRVTPYLNDTINGSQIQYYKSGKVKAKIDYVDGRRVPVLSEYDIYGIKVTDYPKITYRVVDNYKTNGVYKIFIEMSDLSENVKYYKGDYVNGLVDLSACTPLLQNATTGYLDLKKGTANAADSIPFIAGYLTTYGNRLYYRIAVPVPYKDLN